MVNFIIDQLIDGKSGREIEAMVNERYKLQPRRVQDYIARAKSKIAEMAEQSVHASLGTAQQRLDKIFSACMDAGRDDWRAYSAAIAAQRELNAINHLHQQAQVTVNIAEIIGGDITSQYSIKH